MQSLCCPAAFFALYAERESGYIMQVRRQILVINLVGAYVSSAKYTRRGVKVVYLGFVGTGGSL